MLKANKKELDDKKFSSEETEVVVRERRQGMESVGQERFCANLVTMVGITKTQIVAAPIRYVRTAKNIMAT